MLLFLSAGSYNLSADPTLAKEIFGRHEAKLRNLADSYPEAMADWAIAFSRLGEKELAEGCLLRATPNTPRRARVVVSGLERLGRIGTAIDTCVAWCDSHPDDTYVRTFYLGLVERRGTPDDVKEAITQVKGWLSAHAGDRGASGGNGCLDWFDRPFGSQAENRSSN
jgi:hypothetical protein